MSATQAKTDKMASEAEKQATREDFEAQIALLKEEMALLKAQLSSSGERSAAAARRAAKSGADHLRAQGEVALDELRANARDAEAQILMTVREKPVTSLAIAAGVGFLFALVVRR